MKVCKGCNTEKPLSDFHKSGKQPSGKPKYRAFCKVCANEQKRARYKEKVSEVKALIEAHFGSLECQCCGYNKCYAALELHHTDPNTKEYEISEIKHSSNSKILKELEKCELLCANCHREVHNP